VQTPEVSSMQEQIFVSPLVKRLHSISLRRSLDFYESALSSRAHLQAAALCWYMRKLTPRGSPQQQQRDRECGQPLIKMCAIFLSKAALERLAASSAAGIFLIYKKNTNKMLHDATLKRNLSHFLCLRICKFHLICFHLR
jgi:hypothetical protein